MKLPGMLVLLAPFLSAADPAGLRGLLVNRVDEAKKAVGIVVGTIGPGGRNVIGYGRARTGDASLPDGSTVFEIGSITKVFTSLLLADMAQRGEVKLDDPVARYLPATVHMPVRNGREITLLDLSMQVSGLPRLPSNLKPADMSNPYADYGPPQLYDFLSHYTLTRDIGQKYEYSNLGVGLLGHALARRAGTSYEELVTARILKPLGMNSTCIKLSPDQKKRVATAHNAALVPVPLWDINVLEGAGGLRSTADDLLTFLAANLELTATPLTTAMRRMRAATRPTGVSGIGIAMGWHTRTSNDRVIFWHNGGTGGFRTFAGFDPKARTAVVVLCNTFLDIDDIGYHTLDANYPVAMLRPSLPEVKVDPAVLQTYVGEYPLSPAFVITVTREGSQLFAQATGQSRAPIFPSSPTEFFLKVVEAGITFTKDGAGKVDGLVLHQDGRDQKAPRRP